MVTELGYRLVEVAQPENSDDEMMKSARTGKKGQQDG
jgi:hypothetical protein